MNLNQPYGLNSSPPITSPSPFALTPEEISSNLLRVTEIPTLLYEQTNQMLMFNSIQLSHGSAVVFPPAVNHSLNQTHAVNQLRWPRLFLRLLSLPLHSHPALSLFFVDIGITIA